MFLLVNGGMLFVTAAFSSTEFGFDRLHDRNIFYLAPLWLIVLAIWLSDGLPRPLVATAVGIGLALVLPAILPFGYIASDVGVDVVPSALWARLQDTLAGDALTARKLLALALLAIVVPIAGLPRRLRWVFPALVVATFTATAILAWERMIDAQENAVFAGDLSRTWIDDNLPEDANVTKLYLVSTRCPASALTWHSLYLTEFFNARVERAAYIDESIPDGLPDRAGRREPRRPVPAAFGATARRRLRLHTARHRARRREACDRNRRGAGALEDKRGGSGGRRRPGCGPDDC